MDEQAVKALNERIDALTKSVEALTTAKQALEAQAQQADGIRKGLSGGDPKEQEQARQPGGDAQPRNHIETLKSSKEYQDATPARRMQMLNKATQEEAARRRQA